MKILHTVESYFPLVSGMAEVTKQISENLVKLGHSITIATGRANSDLSQKEVHNGVNIVRFNITGNDVNGISGELNEYLKLLKNSKFDIITNFAAQQWASDLAYPLLDSVSAKKVFVPTGFSNLYSGAYSDYFKELQTTIKKYDANVFLSNNYRDVNFAKEHSAKKITIIPNGASKTEFELPYSSDIGNSLGISPDQHLIVLLGSHTGLKGHTEAIKIFRKAKITNATLLIIGKDSTSICGYKCRLFAQASNVTSAISKKKILVAELSRPATINILKRADLMLFPSNVECSPIVLFEAAASKTPFLVTDVGNSKEIIDWLGSGRLLPTKISSSGFSKADINGSALMLEEILSNKNELDNLAQIGYRNWKRKFTWEAIAKKYEKLYESLL